MFRPRSLAVSVWDSYGGQRGSGCVYDTRYTTGIFLRTSCKPPVTETLKSLQGSITELRYITSYVPKSSVV